MCGDGSGAAGKASIHLGSGRHIGAEGQLPGAEGQTQARASTGKAATIPTSQGRQLGAECQTQALSTGKTATIPTRGRQLGTKCQTQAPSTPGSLSWQRVLTHQDAITGASTAPVTTVLVPAPRPPGLKGPMLDPPGLTGPLLRPPDHDTKSGFPKTVEHADTKKKNTLRAFPRYKDTQPWKMKNKKSTARCFRDCLGHN